MAMKVTELNDVKVYNLTAGKSLPQWMAEAKSQNKSLKYDEDFRRRIDIVQDFEFKVASGRVAVSRDGNYFAATGIYPPEVRIFDAQELGMKHLRGLNAEVVDFMFLSDDYRKLVFLMDDRNVEFHAQYGFHHRLRVPKPSRSIAYDAESCNLLVGGSSNDVVRIDLEVGVFHAPVALQRLEEVNQVIVNPAMPVMTCCGDKGLIESYDLRDPSKALRSLQVVPREESLRPGHSTHGDLVTSCAYSPNGMHLAAGTASGLVRVFDVRSSKPLAERDHMNGFAIKTVAFHPRGSTESSDLLIGSADSKSVKIWEACTGKLTTSVESKSTINQLVFVPDSGMFFTANDSTRVGVYFAPSLGMAPKWCSFLDGITEELEESSKKVVFDDYQFVTSEQLEQLGATDLVGTKFLRPYMHGYFMDHRLYGKLQAAIDPFRYEEYRKEKINQKLEAKRTMRTKVKSTKKVDVNNMLHKRLQLAADEAEQEGASRKRKAAGESAKQILQDDRFSMIFDDPEFAIEERGVGGSKVQPLADMLPATATNKKSASTKRRGKA